MWGILRRRRRRRRRSIPTRVGNTASRFPLTKFPNGPSPRVWGIRHGGQGVPQAVRSIPTRVGNTVDGEKFIQFLKVHPHACGEYTKGLTDGSATYGPSPRVWGIRLQSWGAELGPRSIPTRVGNTPSAWHPRNPSTVHPHACGEYRNSGTSHLPAHGPSPRVWGIQFVKAEMFLGQRSIPTRVGNTPARNENDQWMTVHPHACGEYFSAPPIPPPSPGPSPRVWGIRVPSVDVCGTLRSIPTRVGNTLPPAGRSVIFRSIPTRVGNTQQKSYLNSP